MMAGPLGPPPSSPTPRTSPLPGRLTPCSTSDDRPGRPAPSDHLAGPPRGRRPSRGDSQITTDPRRIAGPAPSDHPDGTTWLRSERLIGP